MIEEPPKRLVGWKQYLRTHGAALTANVSGTVLVMCGMGIFLLSVLILFASIWALWFSVLGGLMGLVSSVCVGAAGCFSIHVGAGILRKVDNMEPVSLLTKHNAKYLPEVETLVRGSDQPPHDPQKELLRAGGQEPETPSEQLLRPGQKSDQDA